MKNKFTDKQIQEICKTNNRWWGRVALTTKGISKDFLKVTKLELGLEGEKGSPRLTGQGRTAQALREEWNKLLFRSMIR